MESEVKLLVQWVALVPLGSVHIAYAFDLLDQFSFLAMLRQHEEEVKLRAPLKQDPGHVVVVNHRRNDVIFFDLPHCGDLCLLLLFASRNVDGLVVVAHG